ncbi:hypothetical protein F66182_1169 [Fusarium sp. NRRL 66182]|nr:hypothetical protein F66182_1169 [Fusarium sp. NRRL 66182]
MNQTLDIWVVTKLFRKITNGQDLTMMNLCSLIIAVPTTWVFKIVYGKSPREFPAIAELLDTIKSKPQSRGLAAVNVTAAGNAAFRQAPVAPFQRMNFVALDHSQEKPQQLESAGELVKAPKTEAAAIDPNTIVKQPSISWVKYLWRLGNLIKSAGVIVYTCVDTIITGLVWPTLDPNVHTEENGEWRRGPSVYFAIVLTATSFPFDKLGRTATGVTLRILAWGASGALNIIKAGMPDIVKPSIAGLVGVIDMALYINALIAEATADDGDNSLEWSHRLLADAWAIGSAYNGHTGAKEPYGLFITIGVGIAMNVEGVVLAHAQLTYWEANKDKEDYYPPSWSSSLNGSLQ